MAIGEVLTEGELSLLRDYFINSLGWPAISADQRIDMLRDVAVSTVTQEWLDGAIFWDEKGRQPMSAGTGGGTGVVLEHVPETEAEKIARLRTYQSGLTPEQRFALGENDPYAAYIRNLDIPGVGQNPYQNWQANQQQPMYATFGASQYLNPTETFNDWNKYMETGGGPQAQRQTALKSFNQAAAMPNQAKTGQTQMGFLEALGEDFSDFMNNVLAARYNPSIRKNLKANLGGLQAQYNAKTGGVPGVGANEGFLDFAKQYYNL